jgi:hypothetical protein
VVQASTAVLARIVAPAVLHVALAACTAVQVVACIAAQAAYTAVQAACIAAPAANLAQVQPVQPASAGAPDAFRPLFARWLALKRRLPAGPLTESYPR